MHRPTLKKAPKAFKGSGGHRSKHAVKRQASRAGPLGTKRQSVRQRMTSETSKQERRNKARQKRSEQRRKAQKALRPGSRRGPPRVIAIVALSESVDVMAVRAAIVSQSEGTGADEADAALRNPHLTQGTGPVTVRFPGLKGRLTIVVVPRSLYALLDAAKAADILIPVVSADELVDELGDQMISVVLAQSQPSVVGVVQHLDRFKPKQAKIWYKDRLAFYQRRFSHDPQLMKADTPTQAKQLVRKLLTCKTRPQVWRSLRSFMLVDDVSLVPGDEASHAAVTAGMSAGAEAVAGATIPEMVVSGYLRGGNLSSRQHVHLTGHGTYAVARVIAAEDHCPLLTGGRGPQPGEVLDAAAPEERHPWEQTLPNPDLEHDSDMEGMDHAAHLELVQSGKAAGTGSVRRASTASTRNVVMGHDGDAQGSSDDEDDSDDSDYDPYAGRTGHGSRNIAVKVTEQQKAWEEYLGLGRGEDAEELGAGEDEGGQGGDDDDDDGDAAAYDAAHATLYGGDDSAESDEEEDEKARLARLQAEDFEWPDEVYVPETPMAKDLFRQYRGLKSFHDSPWDAYEDLPDEYGMIAEFESFKGVQNDVYAEAQMEGILPGCYVSVVLENVPVATACTFLSGREAHSPLDGSLGPLVMCSLFRHERQFSVVHMDVVRHASFEDPLPSGAPLVIHYGFRRLEAKPIYSLTNPRSSKNKYERFLQPGRRSIASIYGPIAFGQLPILFFRHGAPGTTPQLVATGTLHAIKPQRLIIKRVVLIGDPFKIFKLKATVRNLFHHPEDIRYFKKVELWSKYGRHGNIVCPLGTHGHFKSRWDGPLDARDTICMSLYTRVYPHWGTTRVLTTDDVVERQDEWMPETGLLADI